MKKSIFFDYWFFLCWIIFFSINAQNEAKFFIDNSLSIYQNHGFINGIIHPIPFSDDPNSWRATKTIISILICGLILIYLFVFNDKKFFNQSKILLAFIFKKSKVAFFVNSLNNKNNNFIEDKIFEPKKILNTNHPILIASSTYWQEIYRKMLKLGVNKSRVINTLVI